LHKISIANLEVTTHSKFEDHRGSFERLFDSTWTKELDLLPQQVNISRNKKKGTLRGLHFQIAGEPEHKLIALLSGSVYLAVIDLRKDSKTFGKYYSIILSNQSYSSIYIPEGFAHGFCGLDKENIVYYLCSKYREKNYEIGILWNDKDLNINWPIKKPILSKKDLKNISFKEYYNNYIKDGIKS
jgi:dTDP-4-dehydrorhamnose 3,5-epimerase